MEKVSNNCKSKASRGRWKPGGGQVAEWFQEKPHQTKGVVLAGSPPLTGQGIEGLFFRTCKE
ncbi:MAG: hypothetical protein D5S00_09290 [Tindallia sp. MSAO_Bac2]|nr:MAG: hypothetical protein D5S00_09290 [Tindallia sp. MSAO_Bac2]